MNKKIYIVIIVTTIMIISSLYIVLNNNYNFNYNTNNIINDTVSNPLNDAHFYGSINGINLYNTSISYKNYTIPNYDTRTTYDRYGNNLIYSTNNPFKSTGFFYMSTNGYLSFYSLINKTQINITKFNMVYTNNDDDSFLNYYQLMNGSIQYIYTAVYVNGTNSKTYWYIQFYNLYNDTTGYDNTTVQISATNSVSNLWIFNTNGYVIIVSNANSTAYIYNIYTKNLFDFNALVSFPESNSLAYTPKYNQFEEQSFTSGNVTYHLFQLNLTTHIVKYYNVTFLNSDYVSGSNNNPVYFTTLSNGTIVMNGLAQIATSGTPEYADFAVYIMPSVINDKEYSSTLYNMNIGDGEYMTNNMIISNSFLAQQGTNYYGGANKYLFPFINTINETAYYSNYNWLNNLFITIGTFLNDSWAKDHILYQMSAFANYNGYSDVIANSTAFFDGGTSASVMVYWLSNLTNPLNTKNYYKLQIKENGLPSGTQWKYTFNGTSYTLTNNSYNYSLLNGNYALSLSTVNGYNVNYPSTIVINNASKIAYVNFTAVPKYTVSIKENGLLSGTEWNFSIKQSSSLIADETLSANEYNVSLENGTYELYAGSESGYNLNIHSSQFTVSGSTIIEYVNYSKISTYTLYLKESGLASSIKWIAYVESVEYSSTNNYINVTSLYNGTYSLSIDNVADYSLSSYVTSFTIAGSNYYINVTFTHNLSLYNAKFISSGIKNVISVGWSINFNGTKYSSDNSNTIIVPSLKNGSYSLSVINENGYIVNKYSSTVTIAGNNVTEDIYFNESFILTINPVNYSGSYTIVLNGSSHTVTGEYNITVVNATYSFSVSASGYSILYDSPITINGANYKENVTFTKIVSKVGYFTVEFIIVGMNPHTSWSVVINGEQYYSNTYELNISLPNGTYYPDITMPNNYILSNNGVLVVNGSNTIYYSSASQTTFGSFVQYMPYFVIFVLIIGLMAIVIAVRRR